MNRLQFAVSLCFALIAGPSFAKKQPPPPQFVVVRSLPPSAVVARTQAGCLQQGMSIVQVTENSVTCTKPMDDSLKSMFLRALATPSYSTNPVYHYRLSAVRVGLNTTVALEEFVQYQNAYGQVTTIPITNRKELEAIHQALQQIKTTWEARLDAAGGDEVAALAASDAARAVAGGIASTPTTPVQGSSQTNVSTDAHAHPSAAAAKRTLGQFQCNTDFRIVGESGGKTLFEAKCPSGGTQLVECQGMSCSALR